MNEKTNNQPDGRPSFGLIRVSITLEMIGEHNNATAVAHSRLIDGKRTIRVGLCQNHLLVSKALVRADTLTIRFMAGLSLVEFCAFWSSARDGAGVRNELKKMSGFAPSDHAWGSGFASRLSLCEPMRVIDSLPIFGREPKEGPFELFFFEAPQRSPSDVPNWRTRNGQQLSIKPLPAKLAKQKPAPVLAPAVEPLTNRNTVTTVATPDPFLIRFHEKAKALLSPEDFDVLEEMAKEVPADV